MRLPPLLLSLLLLASPAAAQEYVGVGEMVMGELTSDDPTQPDGEHYDVWLFQAVEGMRYVIILRSEEFDAYLLAGPPDGPCREDDDSASWTDALVVLEARESGPHVIRVTSVHESATGGYTLEVEEDDTMVPADGTAVTPMEGPPPPVVPEPGSLHLGGEYFGSLAKDDSVAADGAYEDTWILQAIRGEPVTITMRSDDFDTVLRVGRWMRGRWEELAYDDDGADGANSQLTFIAPRDGEYLVLASSFDEGQEGAYTLVLATPYAGDSVVVTPALHAGLPVEGRLEEGDMVEEDGTLVDEWEYAGHEGETITIQMESDDFDTFLRVRVRRDDGGWEDLGTDDDGGSGTDSELTLTLPRDGFYAVHAAALEPETGGDYVIVVRRH